MDDNCTWIQEGHLADSIYCVNNCCVIIFRYCSVCTRILIMEAEPGQVSPSSGCR